MRPKARPTSCGCAIKPNSPEPRDYSVRPHSSWARRCSGVMTVSMTRWLTALPGTLADALSYCAKDSPADDKKTPTLWIEGAASWGGQDDLEVGVGLAHPGCPVGARRKSSRQRPRGTRRRISG